MPNVVIIGFAGRKRAGKDTAAKAIRQCLAEYDRELYVGQTAFADPMYEMLKVFAGAQTVDTLRNSDDKDTEIIEPFGCTLRHMAQTIGTDWARNLIHDDAWVMATRKRIATAVQDELPANDGVVILIPDVRFPNEAEYVRNNGFLIHIQRPGGEADNHASETPLEVEDTDTVIQNNGTEDQFIEKVFAYGRGTLQKDITAALQASAGNSRLLSESSEGAQPL